ncbi:hypothetical protein F5X99DRAFT_431264 [Biscogniauxia marginata]|nr:hypothetical protein F5X99DRAFT_431264 [Biscogniauxia marginata]
MSLTAGLRVSRVQSPFPGYGFACPIYHPVLSTGTASNRRSPVTAKIALFARAASSSAAAAAATATTTQSQTRIPAQAPSPSPSNFQPLRREPLPPAPTTTPTPTPTQPFSVLLNPPSSTRPPPLDLPVRDPSTSYMTHLFRLGKAYMHFYKMGFKAVFANRRLLRQTPSSSAPTRSQVLLRHRVRHDLSRLPVFGLVVLVCGEFTPLVVLLFPQLTPYTCRIPAQVAVIRRARRARRDASFCALRHVVDNDRQLPGHGAAVAAAAAGHVCRSLGLTSPLWDKLGVDGPFARSRADRTVRYLARDDALIRAGGGVRALEDAEVVLACEDRGLDVRGQDEDLEVGELRAKLEEWIRRTAPTTSGKGSLARGQEGAEGEDKVRRMLLGLDGRI